MACGKTLSLFGAGLLPDVALPTIGFLMLARENAIAG